MRDVKVEEMKTSQCSICGEDMECPESMLKAGKHICECCTSVMADGFEGEDEIRARSREERKILECRPEAEYLADYIRNEVYPGDKPPKEILRTMSKKELAEEAYYQGALAALDFMLYAAGPESVRRARKTVDGAREEAVEHLLKKEGLRVDEERIRCFRGDPNTLEGGIRLVNEALFSGDWEKHLDFIVRHGTPEQKKHDIKIIKEIMGRRK
ncbi:MAG: hypothetical protein V1875_02730 [Candidatus Altiarchaeota archaeon]